MPVESNFRRSSINFRGSSPSSVRLESRIRELEDLLDLEREARLRAERNSNELSIQLEALSGRLEDFGGNSHELIRKRDMEIVKLRKELENANMALESAETTFRRKHNSSVNEFSTEIENLHKQKGKAESDKSQLMIEIDGVLGRLEDALKAKQSAEGKLENLDNQLQRMKSLTDELQRQMVETNVAKSCLASENFELIRIKKDYEKQQFIWSKAKSSFESQLEELKHNLDDEQRNSINLQTQVTSLQMDLDILQAKYEEESEDARTLRNQVLKLSNDMTAMKSKLERELLQKMEEFEEIRRKMTLRITELEDMVEHERNKISSLEKSKQKLMTEIIELQLENEVLVGDNADLSRRVKAAEHQTAEFQRRVGDLLNEVNKLRPANSALEEDNTHLKEQVTNFVERLENLDRENKQLCDQLKEIKSTLNDANRRLTDFESLKSQLEIERDKLASALHDAEDALKDLDHKYQSSSATIYHLKSEMDQRLREKNDELENLRKSTTRTIEELSANISEMDARFKSDISRLKKKYEVTISEQEIQIDGVKKSNATLIRENKALAQRIKEIELALDDEHRVREATENNLQICDRKRIQQQNEIEEFRTLLEVTDRAKKKAESELSEASTRMNELTLQVNALTNEKRRFEGDISVMQTDMNDAHNAKQTAEDRAVRLNTEILHLVDKLRLEQEKFMHSDILRKQLEIQSHELSSKLEEAAAFSSREGRRIFQKLQTRVKDLEAELEAEVRRSKEAMTAARKHERQFKEIQAQCEEDRKLIVELQDILDKTQMKLKTYKRQMDEAEEFSQLNMNKYRKAQQQIEEAENRANMAEQSIKANSSGTGSRPVPFTRESNTYMTHRGRATSIV